MIVKVHYGESRPLSVALRFQSARCKEETPYEGKKQASVADGSVAGGFFIQGNATELRRLAHYLQFAASCLEGLSNWDGFTPNPKHVPAGKSKPLKVVKLHILKIVENHYQRYCVVSSTGDFEIGGVNERMKNVLDKIKLKIGLEKPTKNVKNSQELTETEATLRRQELLRLYSSSR